MNKRVIFIIMIVICFIGLLYGSYKVFTWKKDNNEVSKIKEELDNLIEIKEEDNKIKYIVDFEKFKKKNSDTVAYLKVKNTNIDYVVVKYSDNDYYLKHDFEKNYNAAGWVFADYHNKFDGNDKNIVLYGHSMLNGSMFGTLRKVLNKKWYTNKDNKYITLVTEDGNHIYEVFSVYTVKEEAYYINTQFKNNDIFYDFLKTIQNRSIYDFNVKINKNDTILTLSTCNSGRSNRTVLHARKIK